MDSDDDRRDHGQAVTDEIIGRESEIAVVHAFLDRPAEGLRALVLEGEAGIGKSTIWLAAVAAARDREIRVLVSRPAENEQTLPNVVLGDLFVDLSEEVLATLSAPRRRAVEAALLIGDRSGPRVDPRALGLAIMTLLRVLTDRKPLVLAIDDDQWMDGSSAAALEFALRRSVDRPLLLLLARRPEVGAGTRLEEATRPGQTERLGVGPLTIGATQQLFRDRLDLSFPRPLLIRLHEVSGGNPFHVLELGRAQSIDPTRDTNVPVAVSGSVKTLIDARLASQDAGTRRALLLIAAHGRLPIGLLVSFEAISAHLEAALKAGFVERSNGQLAFAHPLLAAAVYGGATDEERRAAHQALAARISDPLLRARHLALGADRPADDLAMELEQASQIASDRGIPISAAELAEHALRLTPTHAVDDRQRRALSAARAQFLAGRGARAWAIAADLRAGAPQGIRRAEALILSAELDDSTAAEYLAEALLEAEGATRLQAVIHAMLASSWRGTDLGAANDHAEASLRLAEDLDDDALRAAALSRLALIRLDFGDPRALEIADRGYALADRVGDVRQLKAAAVAVGHVLTWAGVPDRARTWLEDQLQAWGDRDEDMRGIVLTFLALVEIWAGRWGIASGYVEEAQGISEQYGSEFPRPDFQSAILAVHQGDIALARQCARRGLAEMGDYLVPAYPAVLGICDMWTGNVAAALPNLLEAERLADIRSLDEVNNRWWRAEYVEAMLQSGEIQAAERLLDRWEAAPAALSRERVVAQITRCRGLAAAARGDTSVAADLLATAAELATAAGDPFGRARAFHALGTVRRRGRQKRTAREALEAALAGFEEVGATTWAAASRSEIARVGGRQRIEGLSPSELAVASLVVEGRTNREIALALSLGERTVAGHLTHVYSKLGLRSRTELAGHLPRRGGTHPRDPQPTDGSKVRTF